MESSGRPRPRFTTRQWIWTGAAAVVIVVLLGVSLYVTGEPYFCATCHEMKPEVNGWRAGTHSEVSCFACHSNPGPIGYLQAHVGDGLRDVWVHFTQHPDKIVASPNLVPQSRCLACHPVGGKAGGEEEAPPFPKPPEFPDHPPKTADCAECHRDAIHGPKP